MKRTENEEEHNDFKNAVKGRRIIPIWLTFSLSSMHTSAMQTVLLNFQGATDMSRAEPVLKHRKWDKPAYLVIDKTLWKYK